MLELAIEDVAFGGKGVARKEGKAVFVPFTIDGERITAKIVREKKQFAEAELVQLLDPSPDRMRTRSRKVVDEEDDRDRREAVELMREQPARSSPGD